MDIKINNLYKDFVPNKAQITIFTPTYNRCSYIAHIAEMLKKQSCQQYVWILVNDGSTDQTDGIALEILHENEIPMMYISKENGHKHSCFKEALLQCKTEYFICMDDDDIYDNNAVEFFLNKWSEIKSLNRNDIGAIRTLTRRKNGSYVANFKIDQEEIGKEFDETTLNMKYRYNHQMENMTCYRTEALRSIDLFPSDYWLHDKHRFFSESIWQGRFARKFKCRYVYKALREYNESETQSVTRGHRTLQRSLDSFINGHMILSEQFDYLSLNKMTLFKRIISTSKARIAVKISLKDELTHTSIMQLRILLILCYPLSIIYNLVRD